MTIYASYTIVDHADLLTKAKAFYVNNGWTLSSEDTTTFVITKDDVSHRIVTANNSNFSDWTYSSTNYNATYECTIGIGDTVTTNVICIVGAMPLPCVVDFFIFDDGAVLICAEVASGIWAQAYSGFLDTSLSGDGYFNRVISGSYGGGVRTSYSAANNYRISPSGLAAVANGYNGFLKGYSSQVTRTYATLFTGLTSTTACYLYTSRTFFVEHDGAWVQYSESLTYGSTAIGVSTRFDFEGNSFYPSCYTQRDSNAAAYTFAPYTKTILPFPIYPYALCETAQPLILGQIKDIYLVSANANLSLQEEVTVGVYTFRCYSVGNTSSQRIAVRVA